MARIVRRVVTGHDPSGQSVILEDGLVPRVFDDFGQEGLRFMEVWETRATPAPITPEEPEPTDHPLQLPPPRHGVRIRVMDIPPEEHESGGHSQAAAEEIFERIGGHGALVKNARHPFMHRTETVDFGIVLEGELVLIMDEGETTVRAGDVVVQRGTNHAWANRSGRNCRIAFILTDGKFEGALAGEAKAS